MINRKLVRSYTPAPERGFMGPDHIARAVIQGDFADTDPFILLMDDVLDKQNTDPVGGAHPHAGFETVSLLLEGEIGDESHQMQAGGLQIMTAGSGVVHTETIAKKAKLRLLQLWLNLPKKDRWVTPRLQDIAEASVPGISEDGVKIKVYSGSLQGVTSPVKNYVPVIIADIHLDAGVSKTISLPASFNTFLYVIEGNVLVGGESKLLAANQTGWLDKFPTKAQSELRLQSGNSAARLVLYSGEPTGDAIISHGPFIADRSEDIHRLYREYREGKMQHISEAPDNQRIFITRAH